MVKYTTNKPALIGHFNGERYMGINAAPDLLNPETFSNGPPHEIFDYLRENDPVYGQPNPVNGGTVWSLMRHADIRAVSMDTKLFTSSLGVIYPTPPEEVELRSNNIVWHDPPKHQRQRSFAQKAFSPRVVAKFEDWIRELCVDILDRVEKEQSFDAIQLIALELPGQVICSIMGVPDADRRKVIGWGQQFFARADPNVGFEASAAAMEMIRDYTEELAELRRREPGVDMITELLGAEYEGVPITKDEFTELSATLINAGFETTHTLIAQSLLLMATDPQVEEQVYSVPDDKLAGLCEELLRYVSPLMHFARTATADTELGGKQIAKGDRLILWYSAGNRDPAAFDEPNTFVADRKRRPHQAFGGGGPHFCLGNHLARLEAEVLFDEMRKRGIRLTLDGEPRRATSTLVNAIDRLPMKVVKPA